MTKKWLWLLIGVALVASYWWAVRFVIFTVWNYDGS